MVIHCGTPPPHRLTLSVNEIMWLVMWPAGGMRGILWAYKEMMLVFMCEFVKNMDNVYLSSPVRHFQVSVWLSLTVVQF